MHGDHRDIRAGWQATGYHDSLTRMAKKGGGTSQRGALDPAAPMRGPLRGGS